MRFDNYDFNLLVRLPQYSLSEDDCKLLGVNSDISHEEFLRLLCIKGLDQKISKGKIKPENRHKYIDRINDEISVMLEGGFIDYMLMTYDIVDFAKKNGVAKGGSRGSAGGCAVLFLIGVVDIDPIEHQLFFQRFLSRARIKKTIIDGIIYVDGSLVMDVDTDYSNRDRSKVIKYILDKYNGRSCKLSTNNTLTTKILVKECAKIVLGLSEDETKELSKMVPKVFGIVKSLDESREGAKEFDRFCEENKSFYKIAKKLNGLIRNKGSHASGYLISYYELEKYVPLELGADGEIVSSYDGNDAQKICLKFDILGLDDISLLSNVCKSVGLDLSEIDYNDPEIYKQYRNLETPYGLFQIGADCNFRVLQKVKPRNLHELSAVIAISRPGGLQFVDQFAKYVETGEFQSLHPFFDDILKETGGACLFQEQGLAMTHKLGFSLDECEILRRVIGKKAVEKMPEWKDKIFNKVKELGLEIKVGEVLWKILDDSKNYQFNRSHSHSYSILSAISTYLKFKYPTQFFVESLKLSREKAKPSEEISLIQQELLYYNIKLLPPDIVKSDLDFKEENGNIRYGLASLKGVSEKTFEKLKSFINADKTNKFEVFQAAKNAKLNIGVFCALIQAGALGSIHEDRTRLVFEAQMFNILTERERVWVLEHGEEWGHDLFSILKAPEKCLDNKGKPVFKETRLNTLKKNAEPYRQIFSQNSKHKNLSNYIYEKILAGYSYSHKLKDVLSNHSAHEVHDILWTKSLFADDTATICGIVKEVEKKTSKNKNKYCKIILEDEGATADFLIFDQTDKLTGETKLEKWEKNNWIPKENDVVIVDIRKWNDVSVIQRVDIVSNKVFLKLADLKFLEKEKEQSIIEV